MNKITIIENRIALLQGRKGVDNSKIIKKIRRQIRNLDK